MATETSDTLLEAIRQGIRETVYQSLKAVVQEATEKEIRSALQKEELRKPLVELIQWELKEILEGIKSEVKK